MNHMIGGVLLVSRDMLIMVAASLAVLPIIRSGFKITRSEGCGLVLAYVIYTVYLVRGA